jgi:hypothetical protein
MATANRHAIELSAAASLLRDKLQAGHYNPSGCIPTAAAYVFPYADGDDHTTTYAASIHREFAVCVLQDDSIRGPDITDEEHLLASESIESYRQNPDHVAGIECIIQRVQLLLGIDSRPKTIQYLRSAPGAPAQGYHIDGRGTNINVMIYLSEGHRITELLIDGRPLQSVFTHSSAGDVFFFLSDMLHRGPRNDSRTHRLVLFMSFGLHDTSGPPIFLMPQV